MQIYAGAAISELLHCQAVLRDVVSVRGCCFFLLLFASPLLF
jgi:hypothetical protein